MKSLLILITVCVSFGTLSVQAQNTPKAFIDAVQPFLQTHVENGRVGYVQLKKSGKGLADLYKQAGAVSLSGASDAEKKAFYINAYNIVVIHQVVQAFPLKSPLDKDGFFDKSKHRVAGQELTLNQLEKDKLLAAYSDARVHFVVVCAAISCPPLADFAYTPDKLDAQLDERTRLALNDPQFIRVNKGQKKVEVSKIFDWYKSDFNQSGKPLLTFINTYRREKIPTDYSVGFYEYNWTLNGR